MNETDKTTPRRVADHRRTISEIMLDDKRMREALKKAAKIAQRKRYVYCQDDTIQQNGTTD